MERCEVPDILLGQANTDDDNLLSNEVKRFSRATSILREARDFDGPSIIEELVIRQFYTFNQ